MLDGDLEQKDWSSLRDECKKLRDAIRLHRDQVGDDRCILDDDKLYETLPEFEPVRRKMPPNMLGQCKQFIACRMEHEFNSVSELYEHWEKDKPYLSPTEINCIINHMYHYRHYSIVKSLIEKLEKLK